ncbi:CRISPR-associated helicase Cas3' [Streptomyces sp. NPDC049881]|uniref:CRISPR-associated helicase Cas3' n=1 Tax=Streptomyces sp. NPDC049881 TaxID=3155778 RepID=UPI003432D0B5
MNGPPPPGQILDAVWAKSPADGQSRGESLTSHLRATLLAARAVRHRTGRLAAVTPVLDSAAFWAAVEWACLTHDGGKVEEGFQEMVHKLRPFWGERHEVLSLGFLPRLIGDPALLPWVSVGVASHHRALTGGEGRDLRALYGSSDRAEFAERFDRIPARSVSALTTWLHETAAAHGLPGHPTPPEPERPDPAAALLGHAHRLLGDLLDRWEEQAADDDGLTAVLLQGAVTMADHLSSAHRDLAADQPLDARFPPLLAEWMAGKDQRLRPHQAQAANLSGHLLLRAPTGSGKTEAALLWASRQVADLAGESGGVPRVFYTLPYLASINAMTKRLGELLGVPEVVGVAHSRAAAHHFAVATAPQDGPDDDGDADRSEGTPSRADAAAKAVARGAATRLFHETVRVGTPYQLLRGALVGASHSSVLLDTANSVFVMDELHAYERERLGFILANAALWERLGGRVAVLSATLPAKLAELFRATLARPIHSVDAPGLGLPPRHRLSVRDHHLTDPAAVAEINARLARDESVLVVANNVAHALALFEQLAPSVREKHGPDAATLLHSRFKRGDRMGIEERIIKRSGTREPRRPGLLVATQVVEVSLDVDFDVLFTAAAPLEALLQRFGRVNRVAARLPADVIVHQPAWTTRRGQGADEFADGIYEQPPVEAAWDLLTAHDGTLIDEADATAWLDAVYDSPWGEQWYADVLAARDSFASAFLRFDFPFADRSDLTEAFDALFDGTEAVLLEDRKKYADALAEAKGEAGRLLADDYLIPLPHWATRLARWDRELKVRLIDGDYTSDLGLRGVRDEPGNDYQPGEVL